MTSAPPVDAGRGTAPPARGPDEGFVLPGEDHRFFPTRRMWPLARVVLQSWMHPMTRFKTYGKERVPTTGRVVLASNHIAFLDPILVGFALPRPAYYMAKHDLWEMPVIDRVIGHTGAFPVRRGESDRGAIQTARNVLRAEELLGIFVEGTRMLDGQIGHAHTGAAMLAISEGAPILPCVIHGSDRLTSNPFSQVTVAFGDPFSVADLKRGSKGYRTGALRIEEELRVLQSFVRSAVQAGRPPAIPPRAMRERP